MALERANKRSNPCRSVLKVKLNLAVKVILHLSFNWHCWIVLLPIFSSYSLGEVVYILTSEYKVLSYPNYLNIIFLKLSIVFVIYTCNCIYFIQFCNNDFT